MSKLIQIQSRVKEVEAMAIAVLSVRDRTWSEISVDPPWRTLQTLAWARDRRRARSFPNR